MYNYCHEKVWDQLVLNEYSYLFSKILKVKLGKIVDQNSNSDCPQK